MDCLVRRKDNTIAYINKMHNYNPNGTPRPTPKKNKEIKKDKEILTEQEIFEIFKLYF
tara:strand:+ start:667 stop:840 length:174 start_codon:yes stop_codon:yes gene_type:complete